MGKHLELGSAEPVSVHMVQLGLHNCLTSDMMEMSGAVTCLSSHVLLGQKERSVRGNRLHLLMEEAAKD